jgi:predicted signal transduction protein with EAL and GGDEF domain
MSDDAQTISIDALPDLIVQLGRDGSVLRLAGGRLLPEFHTAAKWPAAFRVLVRQLTRRALASRGTAEGNAIHSGRHYEVRVTAHSPNAAVGMIRALPSGSTDGEDRMDRRKFWQRLTESVSMATLSERSIALAVIRLDGIAEISKIMDSNVSDQLIGAALRRLASIEQEASESSSWYVGRTGDDELAVVFHHADRDTIERNIGGICESLRGRLDFGDASFHLQPYAGVAIFGQDTGSLKSLLESARSAATEARRSEATGAAFFSDTLKLRVLTRLDVARELRDALKNGDIRLRYRARHDLKSGRLVAMAAYVRWLHPMRGEIPPAQFLGAAAATGCAAALSRTLLTQLCEDALTMLPGVADDVRISFGALRHHVFDGTFISDVHDVLDEHSIDSSRLELRISERIHSAREALEWRGLADRGIRFVVDEIGRESSSIERLAKAPIWGLQLDRACAAAMASDVTAYKICRAVVAMARAMNLVPIATAVDSQEQHRGLLSIGCEQGSGDIYGSYGQMCRAAGPTR